MYVCVISEILLNNHSFGIYFDTVELHILFLFLFHRIREKVKEATQLKNEPKVFLGKGRVHNTSDSDLIINKLSLIAK